MSILSVDTIQPIGSGSTVTLNAAKIVVGTGITFESNGQAIYAGIITATSFSGSGANLTSLPAANLTGTLPAISGANLTSLPAQATVNNNADNRVITGGSGVNLNGESLLTFDSSNRFTIGSANPMAATDYGTAKINGSAGGVVAFSVGDTQKWEVYGNAAQLQIYDRANTKYNTKFKAGGNVEITDGNLVLASGHGIDFSATANSSGTMQSELLDDYEEGLFTPTIPSGGSSITYTIARGSYTKIGDIVNFQIDLYISGTADGNNLRIGGLPFTTANQATKAFGGAFLNYSHAAFSSIGDRTLFHLVSQNTYMQLYNAVTGNAIAGTSTGVALFSNKEICLTGSYKAS